MIATWCLFDTKRHPYSSTFHSQEIRIIHGWMGPYGTNPYPRCQVSQSRLEASNSAPWISTALLLGNLIVLTLKPPWFGTSKWQVVETLRNKARKSIYLRLKDWEEHNNPILAKIRKEFRPSPSGFEVFLSKLPSSKELTLPDRWFGWICSDTKFRSSKRCGWATARSAIGMEVAMGAMGVVPTSTKSSSSTALVSGSASGKSKSFTCVRFQHMTFQPELHLQA